MKREAVLCPHCNRRIFDADSGIKTRTIDTSMNNHRHPKDLWKPDYYIKCWKCHTIVGYGKM